MACKPLRYLLLLLLAALGVHFPHASLKAKLQNPRAKEDFYESFLMPLELNDVDSDGTPDVWKRYYANGFIKELQFDLDGDGQPDTRDSYTMTGGHSGSEYLKKFAFWQTSHDSWQTVFKQKRTLPKIGTAGFTKSELGLYVQNLCYERLGKERLKTHLFEMLVDASTFLWKKPPTGRDHFRRLMAILHDRERPLRIICEPREIATWENIIGFATPLLHPDYPAIMIAPQLTTETNETKIKTLLFHELFHLIGYLHYFDREYAYACSACLFSADTRLDPAHLKFSCEVCSRNDLPIDEAYYHKMSESLDQLQYKSVAADHLMIALSLYPFREETFTRLIQLYTTRLFNPLFASTLIREALAQNLIRSKQRSLLAQVDHLAKPYAYPEELVGAAAGLARAKVSLFKGNIFQALEKLRSLQIPTNPGFQATDYRSFAYADFKHEVDFFTTIIPHLIRGKQQTYGVIAKQRDLLPFEQFTIEEDPDVRAELLVTILPKLPTEKLLEHLAHLLASSPDNEGKGVTLYYMGLLEMKRQHFDAALTKFKESEIASSSIKDAWAASALIAFKRKELLKAKEILKKLIQEYPDFGYAHYLMAQIYGNEGRTDLQKQTLAKACAKGFKKACTPP